ncbi:GMC oxidoreductase [Annulohypoxylon maeteangense]|uniref:GMC oxidoreductase n=1 Tax=Annulohypoxylon maeteangense TaxID=1927788 RepID=UPI002007F675|nr:GMC oxidoreductase [Annulohypoxylon maeteangense]KAI0887876.1 GMC oxidoreductase [Annulohypoxylon maeteangense]
MSSETYDVVIVGGGTSGLVLANRLSENPKLQVIVLETGEDRSKDPNTLTPGAWPMLSNSSADWTFHTAPQKDLTRQITIPQGKALGGSSAINSFLFTPTSRATVKAWNNLGNEGWDYAAFEAAMKKSFTLHKPSNVTEGNGPLQLSLAAPESLWEKAWIEGLGSVGLPESDPLSGNLGGPIIAPESIDPKTKQRSYATNAYLDPIRSRSNLMIRTETTVTKVLLEKSSSGGDAVAKGVQTISKDGVSHIIGARKEVIISGGSINSPRILELSGIGRADLLQSLGIDVVVDNPHVGENLQNHIFSGLGFEVRDDVDTIDAFFRQEPEAVALAMQDYGTKGTGPLSTSNMITMAQLPLPDLHTENGSKDLDKLLGLLDPALDVSLSPQTTPAFATAHQAFIRSILTNPLEPVGNYVFGPAYAPFEAPSPTYRAPGKHVSIAIELSHPLSRGSVHITSSAPSHASTNEGLTIDPRYFSHPLDLEVLARQVQFTEDLITRAAPLTQYLKPYTKRFDDLEVAKEYVLRTADAAYHYTGTCSMMPREIGGVVDSRLRVYGVANLRVCDASVVPLEPTANPQAVVYAVAEMGAGFVREDVL